MERVITAEITHLPDHISGGEFHEAEFSVDYQDYKHGHVFGAGKTEQDAIREFINKARNLYGTNVTIVIKAY